MKRRCPGPLVLVVALFSLLALPLAAACASQAEVATRVSVEDTTHRATIEVDVHGNGRHVIALFLTYPDGHHEQLLKGSGGGGATVETGELSSGKYTYTVYWIALDSQDPESVSVDSPVEKGQAVSGTFAIP